MKNNIIQLKEIENHKNFLGNKTLNLKKCVDWGFNVPKFVAIPSNVTTEIFSNKSLRNEISKEIQDLLKSDIYAVRSSALFEDKEKQSYAGQFLTKINVKGEDLNQGIFDVLNQASGFLKGKLNDFSIIIQEYVISDISGVTFSRNPNGSREMTIEYGFCEGEKIVSGKTKPSKISLYWNDKITKRPEPFITNSIIEKFKDLENKNDFPQDVEWCIKDNLFYILQTRSITTITKDQYEQMRFLDKILPKNQKYYFKKTEISEMIPRPSTAAYSLLNFIYSKNGPVDLVYKKYGVQYEDTKFLKIIGNELFVDKEKEIGGLLPAYGYLQNKNLVPKFYNLSKLFSTIKNIFFLNKIKTNNYEKIFSILKTRIEYEERCKPELKTALEKFLFDYELIFEINLLSGLSIKKASLLLKSESINFTEILDNYSRFIDLAKYQIQKPVNLKGNSLELMDESDFIANEKIKNNPNNKIADWWQKIPEYKKEVIQNIITKAIIYNRLREMGRWLAIKNINAIKASLMDYAAKNSFKDKKNIYFTDLNDILNNKIKEAYCIENRNEYEKYGHFSLPDRITSSIIIKKSKNEGVSAGLASGRLQNQEFIKKQTGNNEKFILYTEILSPDLTKYFRQISGIVSNNGGLLSHLAIMARENNIPVIVGYPIPNDKIKLGDCVQIDGSNGKIKKIDKK